MRCLIFCCTLLLSLTAALLPAQNANRPVPPGVPPYEFVAYDTSYHGCYLTTPFRLNGLGNVPVPALVLDEQGYLLWYMLVNARNLLDFKYHPPSERFQYVRFRGPQQVRYMLMDAGMNHVDSFTTVNGAAPDVHDFQISRNQTYLLAGAKDSVMNLSGYLFNGQPGSATTTAVGFVVQEFDAAGQLLFEWNSNDHIHPGAVYVGYPYNAAAFDYCHGNTIEEDTDGHLLLSFRNLNAVYKIDRQTGAVRWQLGGKTSDFTFTNDPGFSGQHDVRRLPNGNLALFDNGNQSAQPQESRAVEYQIDTVSWTATRVWEYRYTPRVFSPAMGGHQTTAERLHLINYGLVFRPAPTAVLVDDAGQLLSEIRLRDSFMSYRTYLLDLPLAQAPRPPISCSRPGGQLTLSAPMDYSRFRWSTGDTTASIAVTAAGTYQLWVPHGAGWLGSEPVLIDDPATACGASLVFEPDPGANLQAIRYFDLLGREIPLPAQPDGRWYVAQRADGRRQLKWW